MREIPWNIPSRLMIVGESASGPATLEQAVRRFAALDWERQSTAELSLDMPVSVDGQAPRDTFAGDEIDALMHRLPQR